MLKHPIVDLINTVPTLPGTYLFMDSNKQVIYVGKAKNLRKRVSSYFTNYSKLTARIQLMIDNAVFLETYVVDSELEALILEYSLIKKYKPKYNILFKDDKSYSWIKITKEPYPIVLRTRDLTDKNAYYFGPFVDSRVRDRILKLLRRQFPFRTCKYEITDEDLEKRKLRRENGENLKSRLCLYYHLGLCGGPCEGMISRKDYLINIDAIKKFLSNKKNALILELEQKMKYFADNLEFEKAARVKQQLDEIKNISSDFTINYGDDEDDVLNLYYQRTMKGLEFLIVDLKVPGYEIFLKNANKIFNKSSAEIKLLRSKFLESFRIECFDISNLSGTNAVGSMVVFEGGIPIKSEYRKFKIRSKQTPDDFTMMKEMLIRRFFYLRKQTDKDKENVKINIDNKIIDKVKENSFYKKPNMVIIDGGKGQLNVALEVFEDYKIDDIFVCALAKKREELFIKNSKKGRIYNDNKETLFLLQRIRDEAHRFGLNYHRLLRSKNLLSIENY